MVRSRVQQLTTRELILQMLQQPGGHTAECIAYYSQRFPRKPLPPPSLNHHCHSQLVLPEVLAAVKLILSLLVVEGFVEQVGAYWFLREMR